MTKPTKKPKAAPTYEEIKDRLNWIILNYEYDGGMVPVGELLLLRDMFEDRERTRWKPSD